MQTHRRAVLRACAVLGLVTAAGGLAVRAQSRARVIPITARRFTYEPDVLTLKVNEPVVFQLTSADVVMGFSVPDFSVRATIVPGKVTELGMTPTKTGEFTFLCDVFCGSGHETMDGTLHVVG